MACIINVQIPTQDQCKKVLCMAVGIVIQPSPLDLQLHILVTHYTGTDFQIDLIFYNRCHSIPCKVIGIEDWWRKENSHHQECGSLLAATGACLGLWYYRHTAGDHWEAASHGPRSVLPSCFMSLVEGKWSETLLMAQAHWTHWWLWPRSSCEWNTSCTIPITSTVIVVGLWL